jgi:hypothetical protein
MFYTYHFFTLFRCFNVVKKCNHLGAWVYINKLFRRIADKHPVKLYNKNIPRTLIIIFMRKTLYFFNDCGITPSPINISV